MSTTSTRTLPSDANLKHLKQQARDLLKAFKAADAEALARIQSALPRMKSRSAAEIRRAKFLLSEAQFVIAREYGFESWPKLKTHVEGDPEKLLIDALNKNDAGAVKTLLKQHRKLKASINEPLMSFDSPPIVMKASNREMVDVLLDAGADINVKSKWWAGGFGVLHWHGVRGEQGEYLIKRGARVDAHAAANLNMKEKLSELIDADPDVVNARGPDGMSPLHLAATPEIAALLLDRGADIDMRDLDHESTPAQYATPYRPEVCRLLLKRGAEPDIFMAAVLGDMELVKKLVKEDPACIDARIGRGKFVTKKSEGMHIYTYNLGYTQTPLTLARKHGHEDVLKFLLKSSSPRQRFLFACKTADEASVRAIVAAEPGIAKTLTAEEQTALPEAAWENNVKAVDLMLEAGFNVDARGIHQSTALDRACIRGYVQIVELLLKHGASLDVKNEFGGTPLGACGWGSTNFRDPRGDYAAVAALLRKHGAK
jgi:ankyrin repeat protein